MPEPAELPFTAIDEGIYHLEVNTNPWNIQVEAGASGTLDRTRLEAAVRAACERHTLTRASMRSWLPTEKHYTWMIGKVPGVDLVSEVGPVEAMRMMRSSEKPAIFFQCSAASSSSIPRGRCV